MDPFGYIIHQKRNIFTVLFVHIWWWSTEKETCRAIAIINLTDLLFYLTLIVLSYSSQKPTFVVWGLKNPGTTDIKKLFSYYNILDYIFPLTKTNVFESSEARQQTYESYSKSNLRSF
jgi:hypothetical protein